MWSWLTVIGEFLGLVSRAAETARDVRDTASYVADGPTTTSVDAQAQRNGTAAGAAAYSAGKKAGK